MSTRREQNWVRRAIGELHTVLDLDGPRLARRLERLGRLDDPRVQLCALAARRLLPLGSSRIQRSLHIQDEPPGSGGLSVEEVAFRDLTAADRQALWPSTHRRLATGAEAARAAAGTSAGASAGTAAGTATDQGRDPPEGEESGSHAASALWRLTSKAQTVRRQADEPSDA